MSDAPAPQAPPRRLTRSTDDRVVAGVCGGLARFTGIDPVIFRVALGVATVLGGAGLVAYVIAWVVIPSEDDERSHAESLLRDRSLPRPVLVALGVLAAFVLLGVLGAGPFDGDHRGGGGFGLFVLVGVGIWLFNRDRQPDSPRWRPPVPPVPPVPPQPFAAGTTAEVTDRVTDDVTAPWPPVPPVPLHRPPRPSSKLPAVVLSTMLLVGGVLALVEVSGAADVALDTALALLLLVLGAGLLVGTWFGRARSLILLGLPLTVLTSAATVMDVPFTGGAGERSWRPTTVAELEDEYHLGAGEAALDLSELDLDGRTRRVAASLAVGELVVILPDATVRLDARTGMGALVAPGWHDDGVDVRRRTTVDGSGGMLELELRLGMGRMEVRP